MAKDLLSTDKSRFLGKTPEARTRQLANLTRGRRYPKKLYTKPGQISYKDLQSLDIQQFAEYALGLRFTERPAQLVILKVLYGLPLEDFEFELYQKLTTNSEVFEAGQEKTEACLCLGARSGKSFLTSIVALYESTRDRWRQCVSKDETSYTVIIATRQQQAQDIIGRNCARMVENSRISGLVLESWATVLRLNNGATIASFPSNSTSARGLPIHCLIFDELAHMMTGDSPKSDYLIFSALFPRTAQFPGAKTLMISTPSGKTGLFWDTFQEGFTVPGRLTCQAPTLLVNPTIPEAFVAKERRRDPDNASREFDAVFAERVDSFLPYNKIVDALILEGDLPPEEKHRYYLSADQSGLAGKDAFAVAVAHREDKTVICDVLRSWKTKDGHRIMTEIKQIASDYNCHCVVTDQYASGWVRQAFEDIGLEVEIRERLPVVYQNLKSLMLQGLLRLPNTKDLSDGLKNTVAYFGKSNTLSIGHPRDIHGHADSADAVATVVYLASSKSSGGFFSKQIEYQRSLQGAKL